MKQSKQSNKKERGKPKRTRQGKSRNTKLSRTPSNKRKKRYRGQGK